MEELVKCHSCKRELTLDEAITDGWEPEFWMADENCNEVNVLEPVCPECQEKYFYVADDGCLVALG